jgi:hypothetical protein
MTCAEAVLLGSQIAQSIPQGGFVDVVYAKLVVLNQLSNTLRDDCGFFQSFAIDIPNISLGFI